MSNILSIETPEEAKMNASFEEKGVWIQLVGLVVALGAYFAVAGTMIAQGVDIIIAYVPLFAIAVILLVIILTVGYIIAAITGRTDGRDERDRLIEWRAEKNSGWILGVGVILAIMGLIVSVNTVWIAHLLLLSMFLSEVARCSSQLVYYRLRM
jgi:hypothetical protein